MRKSLLVVAGIALLAAGCFPILLHVDEKGRVLIPRQEGVFSFDLASGKTALVVRRAEGDPAWARWSPDGKKVLVVEVVGDSKTALRVAAVGGKVRTVAQLQSVACAFWSREGKALSAAEAGMNGVEIKMINLTDGKVTSLLGKALASHEWLPGGKIVAVKVEGEIEKTNVRMGKLVLIDAAAGAVKPVADVQCEQSDLFDVSPDGKKVLMVIAQVAGQENEVTRQLAVISLADGSTKPVAVTNPKAAFWSPDGKQFAVVVGKGDDDEGAQIVVISAAGGAPRVVAKDVMTTTGGMQGVSVYPAWAGNDTLIYFTEAKAYGVAGKAMHLMKVKTDGAGREDLQYKIERGVSEAAGL